MTTRSSTDFIRERVAADVAAGRNGGQVVTRFPPEPNGYLHIGHSKAICISFGIAAEFGGRCHLRFDDTNPAKEEQEYVDAIKEDIRWLGFDWGEHEYYASDYFDRLHGWAVDLIRAGKAYVDSQSAEEIRKSRGNLTEPGVDSPFRDRPVEENLDLFARMAAGEFDEGAHVLRARIDMASPNLNLRDPALYRIKKVRHHRTGDTWSIYPMYDWAHGQSDAIEGVTHSLCSLEFENHRPLYEWFLDNIDAPARPVQIEFARLNLTHTVLSKRKLLALVEEGRVSGWDDPRMPTLRGMRRRGYTPEAIRRLVDKVGVAKRENLVEFAQLEHCVREHLNEITPRVMAVLDPLKVTITNWPAGEVDELEFPWHPTDESMGTRKVPFSGSLLVEKQDFMEDPPRKFHRLGPGREVRLRYAYYITCDEVVKDEAGEVVELRCTYDPESRGGETPDGRKVKGTLHWVSAEHALPAEVRLYGHLFAVENPEAGKSDFREALDPESLTVVEGRVEPALAGADPGSLYQFERTAYFCVDPDSSPERLVFNRTVTLRDSWARMTGKGKGGGEG